MAFYADKNGGGSGAYTGSGGAVTTVADSTSPTFSNFSVAFINAGGTVAFLAFRDAGGSAIFTHTCGTNVQVIAPGDALDGSTASSLNFGQLGPNDSGQLAFSARLADGRTGIYVASLTPVPEPAGLLACGAGLAAASRLLRGRMRGLRRPGQSGADSGARSGREPAPIRRVPGPRGHRCGTPAVAIPLGPSPTGPPTPAGRAPPPRPG